MSRICPKRIFCFKDFLVKKFQRDAKGFHWNSKSFVLSVKWNSLNIKKDRISIDLQLELKESSLMVEGFPLNFRGCQRISFETQDSGNSHQISKDYNKRLHSSEFHRIASEVRSFNFKEIQKEMIGPLSDFKGYQLSKDF